MIEELQSQKNFAKADVWVLLLTTRLFSRSQLRIRKSLARLFKILGDLRIPCIQKKEFGAFDHLVNSGDRRNHIPVID